jgi:hypothetical protein
VDEDLDSGDAFDIWSNPWGELSFESRFSIQRQENVESGSLGDKCPIGIRYRACQQCIQGSCLGDFKEAQRFPIG